jgi:hypothetical protein
MKTRAKGATFVLVLVAVVLMFSATAYAKLVVLQYTFPGNDTQGFSVTTESGCGANFSLTANNGLMLTSDGTLNCAGTVVLRKLVVLDDIIPHPSVVVGVNDDANIVNGSSSVEFDGATPDMVIWHNQEIGAADINYTLSGQVNMVIRLSFQPGNGGTFSISEVDIDSD